MEIERKLADSESLINAGWREVAQELITLEWLQSNDDRIEGIGLADSIATNRMASKRLRAGVVWANALDREAVDRLGNIFDADVHKDDRIEAVARRVAHHAGRYALEQAGTDRRRALYIAKNQTRLNLQKFDFQAAMLGINRFSITRIRIVR